MSLWLPVSITVYDHHLPQDQPVLQLAYTTTEHIYLDRLLVGLHLHERCLLAQADSHCNGLVWHTETYPGPPLAR